MKNPHIAAPVLINYFSLQSALSSRDALHAACGDESIVCTESNQKRQQNSSDNGKEFFLHTLFIPLIFLSLDSFHLHQRSSSLQWELTFIFSSSFERTKAWWRHLYSLGETKEENSARIFFDVLQRQRWTGWLNVMKMISCTDKYKVNNFSGGSSTCMMKMQNLQSAEWVRYATRPILAPCHLKLASSITVKREMMKKIQSENCLFESSWGKSWSWWLNISRVRETKDGRSWSRLWSDVENYRKFIWK